MPEPTEHQDRPTVVVGVDGSPGSETALWWASDYCMKRGMRLEAVLVRDLAVDWTGSLEYPTMVKHSDPQFLERAEKMLTTFVEAAVPEQMPLSMVHCAAAEGDPAGELIQAAMTDSVDLLVVGRRGRGGFRSLLLGSVSDQCATYGSRNTVVVPTGFDPASAKGIVVVGVDASDRTKAAIAWAAQFAQQTEGTLHLVHAWSVPDVPFGYDSSLPLSGPDYYRGQAHDLAERTAQHIADSFPTPFEIELVEGNGGRVLVDTAHRLDASLIVMAPRSRHSELTAALLGSTTRMVLHHAPCPVAVIHN